MSSPTGYTRTQIILHWLIAILIAAQFLFHEAISEAWEVVEKGGEMQPNALVFSHVVFGVLILLLAIWRISIKIRRGSPALPAEESRIQQILAHATHGLLYLFMLLMPLSGMAAFFGQVEAAAEAHEVMKGALLLFFLLHFVGALYHRFILKSGVMERMLKAED